MYGPVLVGNGILWNHLLAFISNFRPQTHILVLLYYPAFPILDPHTPIFCILVPNVLSCKKTQKTRTHGGSGRHRCRVFDSVPPLCPISTAACLLLFLIYCLEKCFHSCLLLFFRIHLTFLPFQWTNHLLAALKSPESHPLKKIKNKNKLTASS